MCKLIVATLLSFLALPAFSMTCQDWSEFGWLMATQRDDGKTADAMVEEVGDIFGTGSTFVMITVYAYAQTAMNPDQFEAHILEQCKAETGEQ